MALLLLMRFAFGGFMHRSIGTRILTLLFALILLSHASLGAKGDEARAVSIRIHDYAHLEEEALAQAQEVVSGMYDAIGVRTDWLEPLQQFDGAFDGSGARDCKPSDLMIIILTSAMANRGVIPDSIIGFAAAEPGVGGRIAYVIYERVKDIARGTVDDMRMMGIVMAHEIGHLLLTNQSHSDGGLMRGRWVPSEIRSARPGDLHFSELQAIEIRKTLSGGPTP
jgi:hypothetical protein